MSAEGFDYRTRTNGEVAIFHHGKLAKMMRDAEAQKFLDAIKGGDAQEVMAAAVGNDGQMARPGSQATSSTSLHGNGEAHPHQEFRRKSG
ncbi:hypothetical protein [Demequina sp. NBRC 110056]|uniref:hypothetical protein n=1 Tax=Demequina sp. NBRC 110056 TaxID=1570345 RepID=UPI0009FE557D|nr:hypothetical protein [Demequina sp. NBRC 110056]